MVSQKKALVLGGAGFLGSHVVDVLVDSGFQVTSFDQRESVSDRPHRQVIGDILNQELVETEISAHDFILNFAGIADLMEAKLHPKRASEINIFGNLNVLEALKKHPQKKYIFASTYYVYSDFGSIYKVTKQACELYIEDYAKRFQLDFSILRYGSLYGGRAGETNPVYRMLKEAIETSRIHREGDGEEIREYIHVVDAAKATCQIMTDKTFSQQHVIIAGQQRTKIKELLEMISEIMQNKVEVVYTPASLDNTDHYGITPYTFKPTVALRYMAQSYHDLGQGLLQMMYQIYDNKNQSSLSADSHTKSTQREI